MGPRARVLAALRTLYQPLEESSSYFAASGATQSRRSRGVADADPNGGRHTSGALASIIVDDELGTVSLLSSSPPSHNSNVQLTRLGHALLDELDMVARAEDVEESRSSPNAPWIESYTGPLPPQGAHGGSGRLATPSAGTMKREPEAAGLPQPHRSGVAARAGRLQSRPEIICAHRTRRTAAFVTVHRRATGSASPQRRSWASGRHFRLGAKRVALCVVK